MRGWVIAAVVAIATIVLLILGIRALLRGRRVPNKAKLAIAGAVLWLLSPIDPLPESLLGPLGLLDDVAVLVALVRYVLDQVQPPAAGEPVQRRVRDRRAIDATDWRLSDDSGDRR
ncbi:MAG TPA: DUF1232 domain-containing protein [Euzebyales bacterium]|nr:DUF1232 domain-containing protein [Euzebyales bacterium]